MSLTLLALWLFMSIFTGCHRKYFPLALPRICGCWPSGLPDYGQESDSACRIHFFLHISFTHELFMSAYLYAVHGKRVNNLIS